ncbi:tetratricopeptide repeat protein [Luteimonas cucumeris]|uniref:Tetratricopeptide repeat protein n=1 Tax=Luteimonas cucumeris TaxID=985012 RepID=A0A562LF37_9GAMM|nr:tetratricopeptide repeat protein [Luteimonas cucumeris]TWI06224.1 tetratricopeptide repeat protein [Luteimonas cucumeris]
MSLIFAALKKLETPAQAATASHAYTPAQASWQRWLLPASTAAAGLLVGVGLFAALRPAADAHASASVAPSVTPSAAAHRDVAATVVPVSSATASTATDSAAAIATAPAAIASATGNDQSIATVAAPAPVLPVAIATQAMPADATTNASTPAVIPSAVASVAGTSASAPATTNVAHAPAPIAAQEPATSAPPLTAEIHVTDRSDLAPAEGQDVARLVAAIGNALQSDDTAQAQAQLAQLARHLPPRSLTLLRMQAWVAHESGDTAAALAYYRQIVERVPGDQATVINLAMLEARNGQVDSARDRLRRLRTLAPGSNEIEKAIAMVEARLQ